MDIKIHTMYFLPEFGSSSILMNELATYLSSRGNRVEIVTTMPRENIDSKYKKHIFTIEQNSAFDVKRFWVSSTPGPLGRLLAWSIYGFFSACNAFISRRKEILFLRLPPLQLGIAGLLAKKLKGSKVVLSVQDIHPDLAIESGILRNPILIKMAHAFEKWVYSCADLIVVISEGFKENLIKKGVCIDKIKVIPNWVDTEFIRPLAKDNCIAQRLALKNKFVIMYAGTISISSFISLNSFLRVAVSLKEDKDILFVIVGDGLKKGDLVKNAETLGLSNVFFSPFLPYNDLPFLFAAADLLLVPVDANKAELSVPSKLYNCMASGRPILCLAPSDSEMYRFVEETGSGISVEPADIDKIRNAILELKKSPERCGILAANGRGHVLKNFSKDKILNEYEEALKEVIK